jgi:hypothetical protein
LTKRRDNAVINWHFAACAEAGLVRCLDFAEISQQLVEYYAIYSTDRMNFSSAMPLGDT